ncbi:MAG: hypothetical protein AAF558_04280 [Verrucomicrobiota bacterium]
MLEYVFPLVGPNAFLTTSVENKVGVEFYKNMGFRISAEFPGHCQGYPCTCIRMTLPTSKHADRIPQPVKESLMLAGFSEENWGDAYRDEDRVWRWR